MDKLQVGKIYSEFKFMMDRGLAKNKVFGQLADEYGFHEYNHNRRNQIKENVNRGKKLAENLRFKF